MTELILPRTETPGAADVGASDFIDLMLTEWYDEPDRARLLDGLADVDKRTYALFGKNFVECSPDQQADTLTALGVKMVEEADRVRDQGRRRSRGSGPDESFYSMLRHLTLTAYYTSEAGATAELNFEVIPDRYDGCAEVTGKGGQESQ